MPKIKEFRVVLPLTLEEYQVGRQFTLDEERNRYPAEGQKGIEVIKNESFEGKPLLNGKFDKGHHTHKIYHLNSPVPEYIRLLAPKDSLEIIEETWDAYPYCRTVYSSPTKESFSIVVETMHYSDRGTTENIHELSAKKLKKRKVVMIDIADPIDASDYKPTEDPTRFKSMKTGRGPLINKWKDSVVPVMTCYTLVTAEFKRFGSQTRVESSIIKTQQGLITHLNRKVFCSLDQWHGMSIQEIRLLCDVTKEELDERRYQAKGSGVRADVTGEASSHPSGEMDHSKDPIEEDLMRTLSKIHLSPGSPSPSPDSPQSLTDPSQASNHSQNLFTYCVQQSQQRRHSSGQESHFKDSSDEDLMRTLEKMHLSPGSSSPSPDSPQHMPDSSQQLFTFVEQSKDRRHQGTALGERGDVDEEASRHPSGEGSHSKDPREEDLMGKLEKIHDLSLGSSSLLPDSAQPMPDFSRTLSQQLFTCVQQIQQDSSVEMDQQKPPSTSMLTSTASALGSPTGSESYRLLSKEAARPRAFTLPSSAGSPDPIDRPIWVRNHSTSFGSLFAPRKNRSRHRDHGACSANRKLKRQSSSKGNIEARQEESLVKRAKYQTSLLEPKKTDGNLPLMGNAPVALQVESPAAQKVKHQSVSQAPKNTASNPPLMGNAPIFWSPVVCLVPCEMKPYISPLVPDSGLTPQK